jgi:hypothetical protein
MWHTYRYAHPTQLCALKKQFIAEGDSYCQNNYSMQLGYAFCNNNELPIS